MEPRLTPTTLPDYAPSVVEVEEPTNYLLAACTECGADLLVPTAFVVVVPNEQHGRGVLTVKAGPHAGKSARCPLHGDAGFPLWHVTREDLTKGD